MWRRKIEIYQEMVEMKIKIDEIIIREDLYPRKKIDEQKVEEYSENLDELPPIVINQAKILIDGKHRILAHKLAGKTEIEYIIEETKSESDLRLRAIELNAKHGLQLSYNDKKRIAVDITKNSLDEGEDVVEVGKRLAKVLSIANDTYNKWTRNVRDEYNKEIQSQIINEYLKAELTQKDVADKFCKSEAYITNLKEENLQKINLLFINNPLDFFKKLSKILQNKFLKEYATEDERKDKVRISFETFYERLKEEYKELSIFKAKPYNIWSYGDQGPKASVFGTLPQGIVEQLIYYYTEPFDVVYDPFGGIGITINACKKWYRRYYASDMSLNEIAKEKGMKQWKIQNGIPKELPTPKLVFLDPPYWKQSKGKYSEDPDDLANMLLEEFYSTLTLFFKELKKKMNKGGYIALIMGMTLSLGQAYDHAIKLYRILEDLDFKFVERINVPYPTQQADNIAVASAQKGKYMLKMYRDLSIFKKK